ncbi:MAG TPA: A/G-specific adenine glycosylase [Chitinophagaceae bacterium]|nr:A/G-specific adenine glycosylase [Chitinophagaceae bacterium]
MTFNKELLSKFPALLLQWNSHKNTRKMPWKGEKDPYKIWLSEIILQQTRVEQGLKYYEKFIAAFPDINKLAVAKDQKIYKLWEGLGYYSRCKNLIETARFISKKLNRKFPNEFKDILSLKGVGNYTASAIASFAYDLPYAVVDGNVFRVLSRVFGIKKPIDSTEGKKLFSQLAFELLDKKQPGTYNQALMDFGAVICKPQNPHCNNCILRNHCFAFENDWVNKLPVKEKKIKITTRWFNYLVIEYKEKIYLKKRTANGIWKNLYEFALIETSNDASVKRLLAKAEKEKILKKDSYKILSVSQLYCQQLSHQKIMGRFIKLTLKKQLNIPGFKAIPLKQRLRYAFPRLINAYFEKGDS